MDGDNTIKLEAEFDPRATAEAGDRAGETFAKAADAAADRVAARTPSAPAGRSPRNRYTGTDPNAGRRATPDDREQAEKDRLAFKMYMGSARTPAERLGLLNRERGNTAAGSVQRYRIDYALQQEEQRQAKAAEREQARSAKAAEAQRKRAADDETRQAKAQERDRAKQTTEQRKRERAEAKQWRPPPLPRQAPQSFVERLAMANEQIMGALGGGRWRGRGAGGRVGSTAARGAAGAAGGSAMGDIASAALGSFATGGGVKGAIGAAVGAIGGPIGAALTAVAANAFAGLGMSGRGVGQAAGGMARGDAAGFASGAVGAVGGLQSAGMGPILGPVYRKLVGAVQGVINGLEGLSKHLAGYNGSIAAAQAKYEVAQQQYNVALGKATAPMLTAWEDVKVKILGLMTKLLPIFKPLIALGTGALKGLGKVIDLLGKGADLLWAGFREAAVNVAAGVEAMFGGTPDRKALRQQFDRMFESEDEKGNGDILRGRLSNDSRQSRSLAAGGIAGQGRSGGIVGQQQQALGGMFDRSQDALRGVREKGFRGEAGKSAGERALILPPNLPGTPGFGRDVDKDANRREAEEKFQRQLEQGRRDREKKTSGAEAVERMLRMSPNGIFGDVRQEVNVRFDQTYQLAHESIVQQMLAEVREATDAALHSAGAEIRFFGHRVTGQMAV